MCTNKRIFNENAGDGLSSVVDSDRLNADTCEHGMIDAAVNMAPGGERPVLDGSVRDGLDVIGDAVDDVLGWVTEAEDGAIEAHQALSHPPRMDLVRHALAASQQHANRVSQRFASDLTQYERLAALTTAGRLSKSDQGYRLGAT